jgi:dTDP-4-amino-4,6-dideoxygalactose transaminase/lipopolysaccharide/colanic/teichoic acid biosynthesis glycosyltransferase
MRNEFLPLSPPCIGEEEIAEVVDTLRSDWITTGPKVKRFEQEFAAAVGAQAALALSSCTAALHLALISLGIGRGDAVLTTAMTFCSGVHVIEHVGARPILIDVEPDTLNINPAKVREAVGKWATNRNRPDHLKAIVPVHLHGHPCEMDSLLEIAQEYRVPIVEDAAHALPASYRGRAIGSKLSSTSVPVLTCFSFYATKNLTTAEGGMLTGSSEAVEEARSWSLHGMDRHAWKRYNSGNDWYYEVSRPGFKYNMTDLQAAIGLPQLAKLCHFRARRAEIARRYNAAFSPCDQFQIPARRDDVEHAWHLYVLRLNLDRLNICRNQFIEELAARNIAGSVHFMPIHLHPYYRDKYGYQDQDFPVAYREYQRIVSLPLHPRMNDRDVDDVIEAVFDIVHKHGVRASLSPKTQIEASATGIPATRPEARKGLVKSTSSKRIAHRALRRAFDVTCTTAGLVFLSPFFVIIAAAIKLEDGGPVFFFQSRVGKDLRKFRLVKFRSMAANSAGEPLTAPKDARITHVGRFLRRHKLDELPQLLNVVKGEMQLVGARPEVERYVELFFSEYKELLQDRPGITDLASLTFRREDQIFQDGQLENQYISHILPRKLELSLKYSQARTFFSDLGILVRTVLGLESAAAITTLGEFTPERSNRT